MKIKELKELLDQYDENMEVKVFDSGSGNVDVTEVYKHSGVRYGAPWDKPQKVEYICIV